MLCKESNINIIIATAVGTGGIFLLVIVVLFGVVFVLACRGKKLSSEPYNYRPLSDAEDAEERMDYRVERSYERPTRDESNSRAQHESLHRDE